MKYGIFFFMFMCALTVSAQNQLPELAKADSISFTKIKKNNKITYKLTSYVKGDSDLTSETFAQIDSLTLLQKSLELVNSEYLASSQLVRSALIRNKNQSGTIAYKKFIKTLYKRDYEDFLTQIFAKKFSGVWQLRGATSMVIGIDSLGNVQQVGDANGKPLAKDVKPVQGKIKVLCETSFKLEGILPEERVFDLFDNTFAINYTNKGVEFILVKIQ